MKTKRDSSLAGRYIGENTRAVYDILHATKLRKIPGILPLVDFEKTFDSVSSKVMYKCLKFFKFGPDFVRWIHIMNDDTQLCVIQYGFFSQFIGIGRVCRCCSIEYPPV